MKPIARVDSPAGVFAVAVAEALGIVPAKAFTVARAHVRTVARAHLLTLALASALAVALLPPAACAEADWVSLAEGADLGTFRGDWPSPAGDSTIVVLRIDPEQWALRLFCASESADQSRMTARQWCTRYGLVAAINAGMFATDHTTHVGYLRAGAHINNSRCNRYQSVAAFCPRAETVDSFRMFDLDATSFESILERYACVVQNLRLIKRPGENRWPQQQKAWSEAALGEDTAGRVLLIFSRSPYSMHDFNAILLSLPIELVCAQHLEGGPEAQLVIQFPGHEREYVGSYETAFMANDLNRQAWAIPNVFGVARRDRGE
ncbi:MAG: phosphodiester glycosidase family protein [Candidatus Eisenbacteria sp.]|nr:phosphodiester glycosidase family protein [Candidatus Eisenbacteria bacterium]